MKPLLITALLTATFLLTGCACELIGEPPTLEEIGDKCGNDAHCLKSQALKYSNAEVCGNINDPAPRSKCFLEIAEDLMDVTMCERVSGGFNGYSREECIYHVAVAKRDPTLCEGIPTTLQGRSTDITKGGFNFDKCWDKAEKGTPLTEECGEELLPCCGESACDDKLLFCSDSFRCVKCGDIGDVCCPSWHLDGKAAPCIADIPCIDGRCVDCGGEGEPCCNDDDDPCNEGVCDYDGTNTCVKA